MSTGARTSSASTRASPSPVSSTPRTSPWPLATSIPLAPPSAPRTPTPTRHAAEFWMVEPEMAFADLNDYMDNAEAMLKYVLTTVMETCPDELAILQQVRRQGPARPPAPRRDERLRRASPTPRPSRSSRRPSPTATSSTIPVSWGMRSSDRARALPYRGALQAPDLRDRLPGGDQGLLHAHERRRQDRRRGGLPGARHRRDHRRLPARGAPRTCSEASASPTWA